jgi:hypothetical protein
MSKMEQTIKRDTHPTKAPGYDLITEKILKELPKKGLQAITQTFNAIFRLEYFPRHWQIGQVIMIPKPGKNPTEVTSYRPISLLPLLSKILEKIILKRLTPILTTNNVIPAHQFGFRQKHGTVQHTHRIHKIYEDLENKRYCTAAFIDISQEFDKVWHMGLLLKLKQVLPHPEYTLLRSYLTHRTYQVCYQQVHTKLYTIPAGVPQGSILGPILYTIFTADLPEGDQTLTATFADDTAVLASHEDPIMATLTFQTHLNKIEQWLLQWRICANETKSTQLTFTLRQGDCPPSPAYLNGKPLTQSHTVKYLGLHLDRRLTWKAHIQAKRKQLDLTLKKNVLDHWEKI